MSDEQIIKKIENLLQELRPNIQMDGGDIEFVYYDNGIVALKLYGSCTNCPMSFYTFKMAIEDKLKEIISEIHEVVAID